MVTFKPRDVSIHRPDPNEAGEARAAEDRELTRIAKFEGAVVGRYRIRRVEPTRFEIRELCVVERFRGVGLGRWLLGHALGLSESKGCRVLDVCENDVSGFFQRCGFRRCQKGLRFEMTPE